MIKVCQKDEAVLRVVAKEVPVKKIGGPAIKKIIAKMKKVIAEQDDAVAVAAPQIGESLRIFVVAGRALQIAKEEESKLNADGGAPVEPDKIPDLVFINPVIVKLSKKVADMDEGCLSVRYLYGRVPRSVKASVRAYDENGKQFTRGGSGLLAQIFQHETDHLNGVLFIDKAHSVRDLPPAVRAKGKI